MKHASILPLAALLLPLALWSVPPATAADACKPDALGTSRTIVVDPVEHARIGTMNYLETLPLADKEVVLTFDDGPLPPYSNRVLETLAAECVRATYFMVGRMAQVHPALVRRTYGEGHTIATHSMSHPQPFSGLGLERTKIEIESGIAAIAAALGDRNALAPFFRFPGLGRTDPVEEYLGTRGLMIWSADFPADDWRRISADEIIRRALRRLDAHGKGILLLHDIQPATALALPTLLRELKARGYRIVHVQSANADRPKTVTTADAWRLRPPRRPALPVLLSADLQNLNAMARFEGEHLCELKSSRPEKRVAAARQNRRATVADASKTGEVRPLASISTTSSSW